MTRRSYHAAAHAVQTGIATMIELVGLNKAGADPKHLRTGIDLSKAEQAGLADLLIAKGVFTLEEYKAALAEAVNDEADRAEAEVSSILGRPVKLS